MMVVTVEIDADNGWPETVSVTVPGAAQVVTVVVGQLLHRGREELPAGAADEVIVEKNVTVTVALLLGVLQIWQVVGQLCHGGNE